jgi:hypothetical protein
MITPSGMMMPEIQKRTHQPIVVTRALGVLGTTTATETHRSMMQATARGA